MQVAKTQPKIIQEIKLPTIKLEPFACNIETCSRFWEQFESSVDKNKSVSTINKHVFLRGYLEPEPKRLVDGIAVTEETYEKTNKILQARYDDKNGIIQIHLDYLQALQPAQSDSPEEFNSTYVKYHRRIQALTALGANIDVYGRVLAPKLVPAFTSDI
jgi:phosphopantetheine adenylyltransferase